MNDRIEASLRMCGIKFFPWTLLVVIKIGRCCNVENTKGRRAVGQGVVARRKNEGGAREDHKKNYKKITSTKYFYSGFIFHLFCIRS
jgi:hypothetical protein